MEKKYKTIGIFIAITIIGLPLYVLRCSSFSFCTSPIPFTFLEILILTTAFFWFLVQIKNKTLRATLSSLKAVVPKTLQFLLLIFLLAGFFGSLVAPDIRSALGIYKAYFFEGFLLFIVIFDYLRVTKNMKLVIWSLVGAGFWIAILAILNQVFSYNPLNTAEFLERGRSSAVYTTSNAVGLFLGPIVVLLFGYFLYLKNLKKETSIEKKLVIISFLTILIGVYSSGSRGAYLGIFAAWVFFIAFLWYQKNSFKYGKIIFRLFVLFLITLFMSILVFFLNINYISQKTLENQNKLPSSLISRICLWEGAVGIIKATPLFGSGLSGFQKAHDANRTCSVEKSIYPHNIFLNFWTEVGFFGLVAFISICAYYFFNWLKMGKGNLLGITLAAILVGVLFHGFLDVPFFKNDLSAQFWVILALGLYKLRED